MSRLRVTEKTREFKKRRRERQNKRSQKVRQLEVREGTQYQSGLGFSATVHEEIEEIPTPTSLLVTRKPCTTDGMKYEQVVFDLETTSRGTFRNDSPETVDVFFEMSPVCLQCFIAQNVTEVNYAKCRFFECQMFNYTYF